MQRSQQASLLDFVGEVEAAILCDRAETATALFLSACTVRKHLEHVYAKLGVATRTQAAATAIAACLTGSVDEDGSIERLVDHADTRTGSLDAYSLTSRESQVLGLVASGASNAEVAAVRAVRLGLQHSNSP